MYLMPYGCTTDGSDSPGAGIMEVKHHQVMTVVTLNHHSTIGTPQTEHHEALPSSVNDKVRYDSMFADNGNASLYSVCRVPMVE